MRTHYKRTTSLCSVSGQRILVCVVCAHVFSGICCALCREAPVHDGISSLTVRTKEARTQNCAHVMCEWTYKGMHARTRTQPFTRVQSRSRTGALL
jgi:hypothetical protein